MKGIFFLQPLTSCLRLLPHGRSRGAFECPRPYIARTGKPRPSVIPVPIAYAVLVDQCIDPVPLVYLELQNRQVALRERGMTWGYGNGQKAGRHQKDALNTIGTELFLLVSAGKKAGEEGDVSHEYGVIPIRHIAHGEEPTRK